MFEWKAQLLAYFPFFLLRNYMRFNQNTAEMESNNMVSRNMTLPIFAQTANRLWNLFKQNILRKKKTHKIKHSWGLLFLGVRRK